MVDKLATVGLENAELCPLDYGQHLVKGVYKGAKVEVFAGRYAKPDFSGFDHPKEVMGALSGLVADVHYKAPYKLRQALEDVKTNYDAQVARLSELAENYRQSMAFVESEGFKPHPMGGWGISMPYPMQYILAHLRDDLTLSVSVRMYTSFNVDSNPEKTVNAARKLVELFKQSEGEGDKPLSKGGSSPAPPRQVEVASAKTYAERLAAACAQEDRLNGLDCNPERWSALPESAWAIWYTKAYYNAE